MVFRHIPEGRKRHAAPPIDWRSRAGEPRKDTAFSPKARRLATTLILTSLCLALAFSAGCARRSSTIADGVLQTPEVTAPPIASVGLPDIQKLQQSLERVHKALAGNRDGKVYSHAVLSAMVTAGMYEDSGVWWTEVGLPAKSGVSGAILAVVPGWGAISAYSPRLDAAGNSVRSAAAIRELVE